MIILNHYTSFVDIYISDSVRLYLGIRCDDTRLIFFPKDTQSFQYHSLYIVSFPPLI